MYLADCMDVLPTLKNVDAVITDPPYELSEASPGKSHIVRSLGKFKSENYKAIIKGFDIELFFSLLVKICHPFNVFCFCSNKQISKIMVLNENAGRATTLIVWHKTNSTPFANGTWRGDIEYCVHARGKGAYFQGNAKEKTKVTAHASIIDPAHPTVKPILIIKKYMQICSAVGHTILDPFMGSGTTGIAAVQLGRKFIGIEREPKYFDIACERIERAYAQGQLFKPAATVIQVQESFL